MLILRRKKEWTCRSDSTVVEDVQIVSVEDKKAAAREARVAKKVRESVEGVFGAAGKATAAEDENGVWYLR